MGLSASKKNDAAKEAMVLMEDQLLADAERAGRQSLSGREQSQLLTVLKDRVEREKLTSITIPSVTAIPPGAFENCRSLTLGKCRQQRVDK